MVLEFFKEMFFADVIRIEEWTSARVASVKEIDSISRKN